MQKLLKSIVVLAATSLLLLPGLVLTQGIEGRVLNRRTRQVFPTITAALAAGTLPGDVLLAAGNLIEPGVVDLTGFSGVIIGESRRGFAPIIRFAGDLCPVPGDPLIDTGARVGPVQLIGLNLRVPDDCTGVRSAMSAGAPLTIRNLQITGTDAAAEFVGIFLNVETGGLFLIENNTISGQLAAGVFAAVAMSAQITIRSNRITNTGPGTAGDGIGVTELVTSTVLIERNTVDGGGPTNAGLESVGIFATNTDGISSVTIQRNTARNFDNANDPMAFGAGIALTDAPNSRVLRNRLQNNDIGVLVDAFAGDDSAGSIVNFNNITGDALTQRGLDFNLGGAATTNLDAQNNFWGAATGPRSFEEGADTCPEATGASCTTFQPGATDGTGLPVSNNDVATADCEDGDPAPQVITCPFARITIFGVGA